MEQSPDQKCDQVVELNSCWLQKSLSTTNDGVIAEVEIPGRPERPVLVHPRDVPRRKISTTEGFLALIHSIAHIEFNAINLALDAVYRFRQMPLQFVSDWLVVAEEEAKHFSLLKDFLILQGANYGDFPSHNGLWDMVCKTRFDVLHRMALVPRVMEARGLDVTPKMIKRFTQSGEHQAADIMQVIYDDEIGHVRIGNYWYQFLCKQREVDPQQTFRDLIDLYFQGKLRGPFNWPARIEAGFTETELLMLEQGLS